MNMKLRKTMDTWDIETNYGEGWEVECTEYTLGDAIAQVKCYRENSYGRFAVRRRKHREKITRLFFYGLRKKYTKGFDCFPDGAAGHSDDAEGTYQQIVAYGRRLEESEITKYDLEFIREEDAA